MLLQHIFSHFVSIGWLQLHLTMLLELANIRAWMEADSSAGLTYFNI